MPGAVPKSGLDQERAQALKNLAADMIAADAASSCRTPNLFSLEERYQLSRYSEGKTLTVLEADTVISRVLREYYLLGGPDPARPDGWEERKTLLEDYFSYQASVGHVIVDEASSAPASPSASGGPDAFGYSFDDSNEPGGPTFNFIDITATGTAIPVTSGSADDGVATVPLGGPGFSFYGSTFTSLRISTNGWLTTDPANTTTDLSNDCPIPNANVSTGAKIFVLHDDLRTDQGASNGMFRQYDAMNGVNIIQWNARHFGTTTDFRFQVQLFDDGTIICQYPSGNPELGSGSTTGIQSAGATTGLLYACNTASSIPANLAVRFTLDCRVLCPADITVFGTAAQVVNFSAVATSTCTGTVTCVPPSGSMFPVGTTPVTCTESDSNETCTFNVTVSPCMNIALDGGFEAGNPWPAWTTQTSTNFGTAICNTGLCNQNPPPRTGTNWLYFGGTPANEAATCGQMVTIPPNASTATLRFYLTFFTVATPFDDTVTVSLGGSTITSYNEPSTTSPYTLQTFDLSAFADGVPRLLLFSHNGPASATATNIGIDDIELEVCLPTCEITCPLDVTQSNDPGQCGAVVNYGAPATTGDCGTVTCSPASGSFFPIGTTSVTCSTTAGPSCSFNVTVNDTQPPSITCPANISTTANTMQGNTLGALVSFGPPVVSDNCPGVGAPVCVPASGSFFPVGVTNVSCSVSDAAGNSSGCSVTITVGTPFGVCVINDGPASQRDTLKIVTDPTSALYRFWQYTDVSTGTIYQGFAEFLVYTPGRSLVAYDHDSPNVRMDMRVDYARNTATATVKNLTTGMQFTLRDRLILDDPACQ